MVRGWLILTTVCFFLVSGYGCGIKARTYIAERERVDQANTGNAGYVKGDGTSMAGRPTRKVIVMEFEREKKDVPKPAPKAKVEQAPAPGAAPAVKAEDVQVPATAAAAPIGSSEEGNAPAPVAVTEYTVQKDDTLQKISKKVYNRYDKWVKIYDANKDKIKNPNFVKPGTVLTIPQD